MATKEIIVCDGDRCGGKSASIIAFRFEVGSEQSAAGDTDSIVEQIDLCHNCVASRIQSYVRNNYERGRLLYGILNHDFSEW